jgi:hypothetical protein
MFTPNAKENGDRIGRFPHSTGQQSNAMLSYSCSRTWTPREELVPDTEPIYRLTNAPLLKRLMRGPTENGRRHTARSLADATGISKSKIWHMIHGRQSKLPQSKMQAVLDEVDAEEDWLFTAIPFTFKNVNTKGEGER